MPENLAFGTSLSWRFAHHTPFQNTCTQGKFLFNWLPLL